jgi:hypothetical protein
VLVLCTSICDSGSSFLCVHTTSIVSPFKIGSMKTACPTVCFLSLFMFMSSVPDPNPEPDSPDPHVFGPHGLESGTISEKYGTGSGSFYHSSIIKIK